MSSCGTVELSGQHCQEGYPVSYHHLTLEERKKLSLLLENGYGIRAIARELSRSPSTICRELKRNASAQEGLSRAYHSFPADELYRSRIHMKRSGKYADAELSEYVRKRLLQTWSPEQVAGRIRRDFPDDCRMRISHSTIYRWLSLGRLEQAAAVTLRHKGRRRGRHHSHFPGIKLLKKRCLEAYRRQRIGDWELDTIVSANYSNSGLLSMCDRKSRYCMLFLLRNAKSNWSVYKILTAVSETMPCLTFTADQGVEFQCYKDVEKELNIPFYFCSPHSPWQKGSVENLNSLVREFFPRGTDFSDVSKEEVVSAMDILNNRPRKCLSWATPNEVLINSTI